MLQYEVKTFVTHVSIVRIEFKILNTLEIHFN
jgi:hypothetical protein